MKKLLDIEDIETVANSIRRIMLASIDPALIVRDVGTLLDLIDGLNKKNEVTIDDVRKSISSMYQWLTTNRDFTYINSSEYNSSEVCTQLRYQLDITTRKATRELSQLTETIDDIDVLIRRLRISIEKEKVNHKEAKREEKVKKKARTKATS